uniref:Uncharacterized protein n=1 Tax=Glossina pallidipes TaxID=7398 RepID=A0A1B0AJW8_GLOPL
MSAFDMYLFSHKVPKFKIVSKVTETDDNDFCDDAINMGTSSDLTDDTTPLLASTPKVGNSNGKSLHRFFGNCAKNNFFNIAREAPKCVATNNPYMQLRPQLHTPHRRLSSELREKILEMSKRSSASDETNELTHEGHEKTRSNRLDDEVNRGIHEVPKGNKNCSNQQSLATRAPLKLQNAFVDNTKSAIGEASNSTFVVSHNTIELNTKVNGGKDERIKQKPQNAYCVEHMKRMINDDNNFEFAADKEKCDNTKHSKHKKDISIAAESVQPIKERINFFNKLATNCKDIKSKFIKTAAVKKLQRTTQFENPLYQRSNHLTNASNVCSTTMKTDSSNDKQKSTIKALAKKIQNLTEEASRSSKPCINPSGGKNWPEKSHLCYIRENSFTPSSCNGIKPREHTEARVLNSVKPKHEIDPNNRVAPPDTPTHALGGYVITPQRLAEIRSYFMYWFFDQDMYEGRGDYQYDIHVSTTQIHKNLNFQLPFFGFRFNYTRVSLNGYLEFSDPPEYYTYPLVFPIKDWPKKNDPSFIGIFFSKCRVGRIYATDIDQRTPGVYFRRQSTRIHQQRKINFAEKI